MILSLLAFSAVTRLPEEDLMSWGWRLPFLASALLLVVGLAIRLGVNESPEFLASREQASKAKRKEQAPVLVSSGQAPLIIVGIALAVVCMASFYAVIAGYVSGMFETRERYTAISMAYQVCGATARGGSCRLALSDEDRAGRELFAHWCREAGMSVSVAAELQRTGFAGQRPLGGAVDTYFEAYIEQGPILEGNAKSITIPGVLQFTVDLRNHQDSAIDAMAQQVNERLQTIAEQRGCGAGCG